MHFCPDSREQDEKWQYSKIQQNILKNYILGVSKKIEL